MLSTRIPILNDKNIKDGVDNSAKTATNYISANNQGIMVYDGSGATQYTPTTAPTGVKNVYIDSDSMDIRDGQTVLATFGSDGAIIGDQSSGYTIVTEDGLDVYADNVTEPLLKARADGLTVGGTWNGIKMSGGNDSYGYAYGQIGQAGPDFSTSYINFGKNSVGNPSLYLHSGGTINSDPSASLSLDSGYKAYMSWMNGFNGSLNSIGVDSNFVELTAPDIKISLDGNAATGKDYELYEAISALGWVSDVYSQY